MAWSMFWEKKIRILVNHLHTLLRQSCFSKQSKCQMDGAAHRIIWVMGEAKIRRFLLLLDVHGVHFPYSDRARTLNMLPTAATALPAAQLAHVFEKYADFLMTSIQHRKRAHPTISPRPPLPEGASHKENPGPKP